MSEPKVPAGTPPRSPGANATAANAGAGGPVLGGQTGEELIHPSEDEVAAVESMAAAQGTTQGENAEDPGDDGWVDVNRDELYNRVGPSLRALHEPPTSRSRARFGGGPRSSTSRSGPRGPGDDPFGGLPRQSSGRSGARGPWDDASGNPPHDIMMEAARAYVDLLAGGCRFWSQMLQAGADAFGAAMDSVQTRQSRGSAPPDAPPASFEQMLRAMSEIRGWKREWMFDAVADVLSAERGTPPPYRRRHSVKP